MIRSTASRCSISSRAPGPVQRLQPAGCVCMFRLRPVMMLSSVAHALEQGDVLEGAGDALRGGFVRAHRLAGDALVGDAALLRMVEAVDAVEHRALAGAVGADDGADLVLAHIEADVGQRLHAAERQRLMFSTFEEHVADLRARVHAVMLAFCRADAAARVRASRICRSAPMDLPVAAVLELDLRLDVLQRSCRRRARRPAAGSARR